MAVSDNTAVSVRNLVDHKVVYRIPEDNVRREFQGFEVKKIKAGELRKLNYQYGGHVLLNQYLNVGNPELAEEFGVSSDIIEYNWTEQDVDDVLLRKDIDVLLDALDFAPQGIVELIKDRAVALRINDLAKRKAIADKLGFDINNTIDMMEKAEAADKNDAKQPVVNKERRVNKPSKQNGSRRVAPEV